MNGDGLWKYLNAMSVSMGALAAGKVSEVGSQARPITVLFCGCSPSPRPSLSGRTLSFIKAYTVKFSDCYRRAEVGTEP